MLPNSPGRVCVEDATVKPAKFDSDGNPTEAMELAEEKVSEIQLTLFAGKLNFNRSINRKMDR